MEEKKKNRDPKQLLKSDFLSGEGISDVEEKKIQSKKKQDIVLEVTSEERDFICKQIDDTLVFKIDFKDVLFFLLLQFLPLTIMGLAMLIPSIYYFNLVVVYTRNVLIILLILGTSSLLYAIIRLFALVSYKVEITNTTLKWRNFFTWISIENRDCNKIEAKGGYYFYLPKIRGIIQIGFEVIKIISKDKTHWVRAYPLRKNKGKELIKSLNCWLELSK
ncbi:MAG: hypothetical protein FK733_03275 [Asgard group archaeon]|nr:hypothetical protein [Asgard group archaeon]